MKNIFGPSLLSIPMGAALLALPLSAQITGPSSSQSPYLVPVAAEVEFTSILSAGDAVKSADKCADTYRMAGIPDGLGAFDDVDNDRGEDHERDRDADHDRGFGPEETFTVVMNHEIPGNGVVRAHGGKGAFVSRWTVRKSDLKVMGGEDQMKTVMLWDAAASAYVAAPGVVFSRFCSGDLPKAGAFFNRKTGKGFDGRIYLNGEETAGGRAMGHVVEGRKQGTSYELAALGRAAWENQLASPFEQDKTVVVGDEDATPGSVFVYVGAKRTEGNPVEKAGLVGGTRYGVAVKGVALEDRAAGIPAGTRFSLVAPADPALTKFNRPEDGAWDTKNPNRYYFVTTDRFDQVKDGLGATIGRTRLWRLTFDSIKNPEAGGTLEMMLNGTEPIQMLDNITVDASGKVTLQEDVGNSPHNGKVWSFDPDTRSLTLLGKHDTARFGDIGVPAGAGFNQDEESSGVIDVTDIFKGVKGYDTKSFDYFLIDVQAHVEISATDPDVVEKGQLLMMKVAK
jgi:hypothetical protein